MPIIVDLRGDIKEYIQRHGISRKWEKAKMLFETNPSHPSLHTELLEPKHRLIYSFRIDRRYRALFVILPDNKVEVIAVTETLPEVNRVSIAARNVATGILELTPSYYEQ